MNKSLFFAAFFVVFALFALPSAYADNYQCKDCITTCSYLTFTQEEFEDCFLDQCKSMGQACSHVELDEAINYVERVNGCIHTCLNKRSQTEADIKQCQKQCNQSTSLF